MFDKTVEIKTEEGSFVQLSLFAPEPLTSIKSKIRPCILILAGGGYEHRSEREGTVIALEFASKGYFTAVLSYSVRTPYKTPLCECCAAMAHLRSNAEEYGIDPEHIAAIGFSAGGHLCGLLATVKSGETVFGLENVRPDAVILSYPVVTTDERFTHAGTKNNITANGKITAELSIEKRVDSNSSPAFIWHTAEDESVPVENSLLLAGAYRRNKLPFELHVFEKGRHGLSLCTDETCDQTEDDIKVYRTGSWVNLAYSWLQSRGFAVKIRKE